MAQARVTAAEQKRPAAGPLGGISVSIVFAAREAHYGEGTELGTVSLKSGLRSLLRLAGKGDQKVAAVFGLSPDTCRAAVTHVRAGAPEIPVWLYSTEPPDAATETLCERVSVRHSTLGLFLLAEAQLWRRWVALGVTAWTGKHGAWPLKLAPFAIPPFRAVLLNEHGDFFAGSPAAIALHIRRRLKNRGQAAINRTQDFWLLIVSHISARLLWLAAACLRLLGYPHRKLFARITGRESLALRVEWPNGTGIVPYTPKRGAWDAEAFDKAVRTSGARWLLWSEDGIAEGADDLLPLFSDARTFAVARQDHYRAWTPAMLPMSPFRPLQAGEACRVLAPLAGAILVDREKLAALGIPRCALPGATWLVLFWKAAAAGWTSYSVGGSGRPARQSDRPMEETSLFLRLLASRRLRSLGAAEPDLARGTISFQANRSVPAAPARKPRVLVVTPFLPYPLSHGGAVRIYNLCRALAADVDFALVAVREQNEHVDYDRLHNIFRQVHIVDLDELPSPDLSLPKQVRHYNSRSLRALIADLAGSWHPDLLQIEYTQLAAFRDAAPQTPAILVEHDITFSLYRQLAQNQPGAEARAEYERWHRFESHWLRRFDGVWTVSAEDRAAAIDEGSPPDRTISIPNGVDTARFVPAGEPEGEMEVFYVGSFRHVPNVIGFDRLNREIMPRIWERFPEVRLRVVAGPDHEVHWRRFARNGRARVADRRIAIHGFVDDLRPLYANATVVVAPLEVSAGTNVKVLEAMASGRPLVSTPVGCAGLGLRDGEDVLIRADPAAFADAVCDLLASPARRRALAAEARRTVERSFDWKAIAQRACASYRAIAPPHHSNWMSDTPWRGSENAIGISPPPLDTHFGESSSVS
jgi:glycosyltransferase involved in cell wall biosynthesis